MTAARERLGEVRLRLLELHRRLLESERVDLERFQGRMSGAEFLQIAADSLRLAWLSPLSELIVELDEALDEGLEDDAQVDALLARVGALLAPPDPESPFGRRYLSLLQLSPDVAVAHGALVRALADARGPAAEE